MATTLSEKAQEIMQILSCLPSVKKCTLYGSIAEGRHDELSDIDIEIDVSGLDNGRYMLELTSLLKDKLPIIYSDYAPSLIPEKYIVSMAIDAQNPFRMVDVCCRAEPHVTTLTRENIAPLNGRFTHTLKLWTSNLKHHVRGADCRRDIVKMASRLGIPECETKTSQQLLADTLEWLEANKTHEYETLVASCRRHYENLIK